MTRAPRVVILDDHELLAQSLCFALAARGLDARVQPLADRAAVLDQLLAEPPEVVLLDLQLGEPLGSGATLVRPLATSGVRVLVVSGVADLALVGEAVEAGAVGYVSKNEPFETLLEAATRVAHGVEAMPAARRTELLTALRRRRAEEAAGRALFERLSPREREVLRFLSEGEAVGHIAERCYVSVPTVRSQVRAILTKLDVGSQLEAVALAHHHRWYDAEPAEALSA